ncbi:unnamed protein product [Phytophthora lilii]|uniref:Unnamed protein product n=1 Tax=Phytophthora lilii TaxID=2077276 RepID=A0A9W6UAM3_9STRA|nr:unnamed protein product [Phytophthora lilii]
MTSSSASPFEALVPTQSNLQFVKHMRIMSRGYEPRVARLMETVKSTVRAQPGLLSVETYAQVDDHTKYVVFSEVRKQTLPLEAAVAESDALLTAVGIQEGLRHVAGQQGVPGVHQADQRAPGRAGPAHAHFQDPQGRRLSPLSSGNPRHLHTSHRQFS